MKWLVFIVAVLASYPVGWWLRGRPSTRGYAWSLCGFLPFFLPLQMALVPFGERPGDTYGLEVAVLDWLALSLFFAHRGPSRRVPNRVGRHPGHTDGARSWAPHSGGSGPDVGVRGVGDVGGRDRWIRVRAGDRRS